MIMKKRKIVLCSAIAILLAMLIGCYAYVNDYYHCDVTAKEALLGTDTVMVDYQDKCIIFTPDSPKAGFIFYPGGKVEPTAYATLLLELAKQDVLCILIPMPYNLAVLNPNAAEGVAKQFPEIKNWYIGGHSLGGSMAAGYAAAHEEELEGLVLLAAYSTADLNNTDVKILSLYGSEDKVLNMEKYGEYHKNLPQSVTEIVIEGGNHAGFGNYGPQDGDGPAQIPSGEQIQITAKAIVDFMKLE